MKRLLFITILFAVAIIANADRGAFTVKDWQYEAVVHTDNTWDIRETILVNFSEPRHGIYHYIPSRFTYIPNSGSKKGQRLTYISSVEYINVINDNFEIESNEDKAESETIIIGDEDIEIIGDHKYIITYRIKYYDDRINDHDFLFHSVLGNGWNTTIDKFSFYILFDKPLPSNTVLSTYSGGWDTQEESVFVNDSIVDGNMIVGSASNIQPNKAITLFAHLPQGFYNAEIANDGKLLRTMFYITIIFAFIILAIAFSLRKPTLISPIQFDAPEGISSAEVGTIIDDSADLSDLTSLIIWFASKGYLKIKEIENGKKGDLELTKIKELPSDAPNYQRTMFQVLFEDSNTLLLSELGDKHTLISNALSQLSKHFTGKNKLTKLHPAFWLAMLLPVVQCITISKASAISTLSDGMVFEGLLCLICGWLLITISYLIGKSSYFTKKSEVIITKIVFLIIAALPVAAYCTWLNDADALLSLPEAIAIIVLPIIAMMYGSRFSRNTIYREQMISHLVGFRDFIEKAEKPMLDAMVHEQPELFYNILPYAMVFKLTDIWQNHFKDIELRAPSWYETSTPAVNNALFMSSLTHHINNNIHSAIAQASINPSASSSSGGFAGGGGGGGGGGSW